MNMEESPPAITLSRIAQCLALLIPVAYLAGYSYRVGLISGLGLDESLVPLSIEGYIRTGFLSLLTSAIRAADWGDPRLYLRCLIVAFVIASLAVIGASVAKHLRRRVQIVRDRIALMELEAPDGVRMSLLGVRVIAFAGSVLITVMTIVIYLILLVAVPYGAGQFDAQTAWRRLAEPVAAARFPDASLRWSTGSRAHGKLVECAEQWCIIFERDRSRFMAVSPENIEIIAGVPTIADVP